MADCSPRILKFAQPLTGVRLRGDALAEAQRETDLQDARQRGYDEAVAELEQKFAADRAHLGALQEQTLRRLAEREQELHAEMEAALPDLIVEGARRVLAEIEFDAPLVEKVVRSVLDEQVRDGKNLVVLLSPRDCGLMENLRADLEHQYPNIQLQADAALQPGDCLVRSRFGVTDARLDTKLKNLREALS